MIESYRKKPVVISAIEWTGKNLLDVTRFIENKDDIGSFHRNWGLYCDIVSDYGLTINTLEGAMSASVGDYIIKGVAGEFYPCKPDIFLKTYDKVQ